MLVLLLSIKHKAQSTKHKVIVNSKRANEFLRMKCAYYNLRIGFI